MLYKIYNKVYCTSVQVTLFRIAIHNAKFKHRNFKVYTERTDKTPRIPYFATIKNEEGLKITFTLHPLYYQERDPPVPLDMKQGGKHFNRTKKKISTG
jgi:hypothetical protein